LADPATAQLRLDKLLNDLSTSPLAANTHEIECRILPGVHQAVLIPLIEMAFSGWASESLRVDMPENQ
jgi:hypothetical protein